ncbi:MAG TPA: hypothetical protein PLB93_01265 [Candidatus Paceibacterota bacterium]|jgi:hypothetical protein|nr:hypothetical protein [Candidatus Paceibacterota bacterium]
MTKAIAITKDFKNNLKLRKNIFIFLIISFILLASSYAYLVVSLTCNAVERRNYERKITSLNGQVNELDLIYLHMIKDLDKEYAISNGFTDNDQNLFVSRNINQVAVR